jgi:DNA polymerase-1
MSKPVLLVDGDTYAYKAALVCDTMSEGVSLVDKWLERLGKDIDNLRMDVFITGDENFRKEHYPPYKGNRVEGSRPKLLDGLKDHLQREWFAIGKAGLEADDLQGIYSAPDEYGDKIIVSIDKDLRQIKGKLYNINKPDLGIQDIFAEAADIWFYTQWLTGDSTDGYPGVPGIGPKKAERIINDWLENNPIDTLHIPIMATYREYMMTDEFAIAQARCARILRPNEYCLETDQIHLWTPPNQ